MNESEIITAVGVAVAAGFWIATQYNIWLARKSVQQSREMISAAISDINGRIDSKFEDMPEAEEFSTEAVKTEILSALEERLEEIPHAVGASVRAQVLELKGEETKKLQAALSEAGIMEAVGAETDAALQGLSPTARAALEIGQLKISKKYERDNPILAMFAKMTQGVAVQQLAQISPEMAQSINRSTDISTTQQSGRSKIGVR